MQTYCCRSLEFLALENANNFPNYSSLHANTHIHNCQYNINDKNVYNFHPAQNILHFSTHFYAHFCIINDVLIIYERMYRTTAATTPQHDILWLDMCAYSWRILRQQKPKLFNVFIILNVSKSF